jgi:hypothetical protein
VVEEEEGKMVAVDEVMADAVDADEDEARTILARSIVLPADESELATKHCRYVVPTEIKMRPTFDDEMKNSAMGKQRP